MTLLEDLAKANAARLGAKQRYLELVHVHGSEEDIPLSLLHGVRSDERYWHREWARLKTFVTEDPIEDEVDRGEGIESGEERPLPNYDYTAYLDEEETDQPPPEL